MIPFLNRLVEGQGLKPRKRRRRARRFAFAEIPSEAHPTSSSGSLARYRPVNRTTCQVRLQLCRCRRPSLTRSPVVARNPLARARRRPARSGRRWGASRLVRNIMACPKKLGERRVELKALARTLAPWPLIQTGAGSAWVRRRRMTVMRQGMLQVFKRGWAHSLTRVTSYETVSSRARAYLCANSAVSN